MLGKFGGAEIKDLRVRARMTQIALADYCGVDKSTVNRWERCKHRPSQLAHRQLARLSKREEYICGMP